MRSYFHHVMWLVLLLVNVAGCGNSEERSPVSPGDPYGQVARPLPADAAPPELQVFRYLGYEPSHLDMSIDIYHSGLSEFLYERLCMLSHNNELIPGAATHWEVSEDGLTWTFYLESDRKWSDNRPLTAHDFEYSFKRMLKPESAAVYAFFYYDIKGARRYNQGETTDASVVGIRAVDDLTLTVETEEPCAILPYIVSYPTSAPVPRWQVEKHGPDWTMPGNSIGNAAFHLESWTRGSSMTFGLNPYYTGPNPAYLRRIVRIFDQTLEAAGASGKSGVLPYESNESDIVMVPPVELERIQADPDLKSQLWSWDRLATVYLYFKTHVPPFDNVLVRRAISKAIDQEAIANVVLRGMMVPAYTMLLLHYPGYSGDEFKQIQSFDPVVAAELMSMAGYPGGRGFPETELWLKSQASTAPEGVAAQAIQQMLKDHLNIDVEIRNMDRTTYEVEMKDWAIPMSTLMFTYDFPDPHNMLSLVWHSQPKGYSRHDWKSERFDAIVDQAVRELDHEKRMSLYTEAEQILVEDAGGVFLWHVLDYQLRKPWVKGLPVDRWGNYPFYNNNTSYSDIYIGDEAVGVDRPY